MPEELKKMMSRQASAEREKRATITKAEGDREAAINLAAAAQTMGESPGAMQLRTLQTIDGLGPDGLEHGGDRRAGRADGGHQGPQRLAEGRLPEPRGDPRHELHQAAGTGYTDGRDEESRGVE